MHHIEKNPPYLEWELLPWEPTPYNGVFVSIIAQEPDPNNPNVPKYTQMAVRVDSGSNIPLHIHNRDKNWQETITFPQGGTFTLRKSGLTEDVSTADLTTLTIAAREIFGLVNRGTKPLYFYSKMKPGFTGYGEIETIDVTR